MQQWSSLNPTQLRQGNRVGERPMRGGGVEEERGELLQTMGRLNSTGMPLLLPWGLLYIGGGGRLTNPSTKEGATDKEGGRLRPRVSLGAMRPPLAPSPMRMGLLAHLGGRLPSTWVVPSGTAQLRWAAP